MEDRVESSSNNSMISKNSNIPQLKKSNIKNINVESTNVLDKSVLDYLDGKLIGNEGKTDKNKDDRKDSKKVFTPRDNKPEYTPKIQERNTHYGGFLDKKDSNKLKEREREREREHLKEKEIKERENRIKYKKNDYAFKVDN